MKKIFKKRFKIGVKSNSIIRIILLLMIAGSSITGYTQTIGIVQGLTPVSPTTGLPQPITGSPTVDFPVVMGGPGEIYVNRFYKFNSSGQLEELIGVPVQYDPLSFTGSYGYCVNCTVGDIPPLYRAITLNCPNGSAGPWKPDPYSDQTLSVQTNPCTNSTAWTNPLTWYDYKVPNSQTGGFYINRDVTLDVNYDATNKGITCSNGSALTINSDVTFTSVNTVSGRFINNGVMNGTGQHGKVVNNGVLAPGGNGIGIMTVRGGNSTFIQSATASLNMQLESTNSFDNLRFYETFPDNVLGGTLNVSLINGFVPVANNSFKIIETGYGGTYTGTFSNVNLPSLPTGLSWRISYNLTDVTLEVVSCIPQTYYADTDGDGYGDAGASLQACEQPSGYVSNSTDCNDGDVNIHPGAVEVCDGIDNNCDGQIDEGFPTITYYRDADGDGYGSAANTTTAKCAIPAGYVTNSTDCNDNPLTGGAAIHPGAIEVCDGVDNNCNGLVDENCGVCKNATGLTTTNITATSAKLNWVATANPVQWQVQYKTTNQGSKWVDVLLTGDKRSVTISSLLARQDYNWHIRAKCGNAWTAYSISVNFKTFSSQLSASVQNATIEIEKSAGLIFYPNPTNGQFKIALRGINNKLNASVLVEIENEYGQLVYNSKLPNNYGSINITMDNRIAAAGVYMVHCIIDGKKVSGKIVIGKY